MTLSESTLSETIEVSAALEQVWPFVADPVGHATWNDKIVDVDRRSDTPIRLGEHFNMTYRMSGKNRLSDVGILEYDPPRKVLFRHRFKWKSQQFHADESYTLQQVGDQVKVTQSIDLSAAGIPWIIRLLIWFISRFGKPLNKSSMQRLKEEVEKSAK